MGKKKPKSTGELLTLPGLRRERAPLFNRYPGSKKSRAPQYLGERLWDIHVEPFLGAGHCALQSGARYKFVGEADNAVRSVWECWASDNFSIVKGEVDRLIQLFADMVEEYPDSSRLVSLIVDDSTSDIPQLEDARVRLRRSISEILGFLFVDKFFEDLKLSTEIDPPSAVTAAAEICLRKLTYAGVVRTGESSQKLNIKWVLDQIPSFLDWDYQPPPSPDSDIESWRISDSSSTCMASFRDSNIVGNALAIIDPPYYLPREYGKMTACYRGHKPHSASTFFLCTNAVNYLSGDPRIKRMVVCNYYCQNLDDVISGVCSNQCFDLERIEHGVLDTMHNSSPTKTQAVDHTWILTRD